MTIKRRKNNFERGVISFVGIMGLPVITVIITVAIMMYDHNQNKKITSILSISILVIFFIF